MSILKRAESISLTIEEVKATKAWQELGLDDLQDWYIGERLMGDYKGLFAIVEIYGVDWIKEHIRDTKRKEIFLELYENRFESTNAKK